MPAFYRFFGVYGVCFQADCLLVIDKGRGPNAGKFDLPGGRLENEESLINALVRECWEETGLCVSVEQQLGAYEYFTTWEYPPGATEFLHQIAILYQITPRDGSQILSVTKTDEDALAARLVPIRDISESNSSPIVVQAVQWYHAIFPARPER